MHIYQINKRIIVTFNKEITYTLAGFFDVVAAAADDFGKHRFQRDSIIIFSLTEINSRCFQSRILLVCCMLEWVKIIFLLVLTLSGKKIQ